MADPVALDDSYEIGMDSVGVLLDVLANDFDPDGDPLVVVFVDGGPGAVGTFSISGDYQSVVYTPAPGWTGTEVAFYLVGNEPGLPPFFVGAEITIEVVAQIGKTDPVALDDAATTAEDTAVTISVLVNDTDADGDTLSVGAVTDGTFGSVIINGDGTVTYTPDADFFGTDSFTYTASDGLGGSDTATVDVTVTPVSDAPVARDDAFVTDENAQLTGDVLADNGAGPDLDVDGDTLTVSLVDDVAHGTLALNPDGTFSYDPDAAYFGTDSFTYSVSDGEFSDTATVTFTIDPLNQAPVAQDDAFTLQEDTQLSGDVLADNGAGADTDADGGPLTVTLGDDVGHGTLVLNPDGTFTYDPDADYFGTDSFTYSLSDGQFADTATVTLTIDPVNDTPLARDDAFTVQEDIYDFLIGGESSWLIFGRDGPGGDRFEPFLDLRDATPDTALEIAIPWSKQDSVASIDIDNDGYADIIMDETIVYGGVNVASDGIIVICFAGGTLIDTPDGARPAGQLRAGDLVMTKDHGAQPLVWTGGRSHQTAELIARPQLRPVRIRAGALGPGVPVRDLVVSRQHRILVSGSLARRFGDAPELLVPAARLIGLPGFEREDACRPVTYVHLLCARHEILTAEGACAESLYAGDRVLQSISTCGQAAIAQVTRHGPMHPARPFAAQREPAVI